MKGEFTKIQLPGVTADIDSIENNDTMEQYEYNLNNRLKKVVKNGNVAEYTYGADGNRYQKTVNGEVTKHIWDGSYITAELDGNGEIKNRYQYGRNLLSSGNIATELSYYLYNGHGDVTNIINYYGEIDADYTYDAFGNQTNTNENDIYNPFRYCGEYYDDETGLIYLRNRYYDPSIGAFINEDPYWNPSNMIYGDNNTGVPDISAIMQSSNLYAYCMGNPVMFVDLWGLLTGDAVESISKLQELKQLKIDYNNAAGENIDVIRANCNQKAQEIRDWILRYSPLMNYAAFNGLATEIFSDSGSKNTMASTELLIEAATYTAANYYSDNPHQRVIDKKYIEETQMVDDYKKSDEYLSINPIYAIKYDGKSFWNREFIRGSGSIITSNYNGDMQIKYVPFPKIESISYYYLLDIQNSTVFYNVNSLSFDPYIREYVEEGD